MVNGVVRADELIVDNHAKIDDNLDVGGDINLEGNLFIKGKMYSVDDDGNFNPLDVQSTIDSDIAFSGIENTREDLADHFPANTNGADVDMQPGDSSDMTNKTEYSNGENSSGKGTLYVDQLLSAGSVASATALIAANVTPNADGTMTAGDTSYVLPSAVLSDNIYCKRIFPRGYDCSTGDDNNPYKVAEDSTIGIYSKKIKLDTLEYKKITADNTSGTDSTIDVHKLVVNDEGTYNGAQTFNDKVVMGDDESVTDDKNSATLLVKGKIICKEIEGGVTATSATQDSISVSTINTKEGDIGITINGALNGYPTIFTGDIDCYEELTEQGSGKENPLRYSNIEYDAGVYDKYLLTLNYNTLTGSGTYTMTKADLMELAVTHGCYCSNKTALQLCNMLLFKIDRYNTGAYYYDGSKLDDLATSSNSYYIYGNLANKVNGLNILADINRDPSLLEKLVTFYASINNSIGKGYVINGLDPRGYVKNVTVTNTFYNIDLDLDPYQSVTLNDNETCYLRISIKKSDTNPKSTIGHVIYRTESNTEVIYKTNEGGPDYSVENTEEVLQFLVLNLMGVLIRNNVTAAGDDFIWLRSLFKFSETISDTTITLPNEEFASRTMEFEKTITPAIEFWKEFKKFLQKTSLKDLGEHMLLIAKIDIDGDVELSERYLWEDKILMHTRILPKTASVNQLKIYKYSKGGVPYWEWETKSKKEYKLCCKYDSVVHNSLIAPTLEGDVDMYGVLHTDRIAANNPNNVVSIENLSVSKLFLGESLLTSNTQIDSNSVLSKFTNTSYLYNSFDQSGASITGNIVTGEGTRPSVVYDFNRINDIIMCGVRPIIIPGNYVGSYYKVTPLNKIMNGIYFQLQNGIELNPYNFTLDYATTLLVDTKWSSGTASIDDKSKFTMNNSNEYVIAQVPYTLVRIKNTELASEKKLSESDTICETGYVTFYMLDNRQRTIIGKFRLETEAAYGPEQNSNDYIFACLVISGFRFTATLANSDEFNTSDKPINYYNGVTNI